MTVRNMSLHNKFLEAALSLGLLTGLGGAAVPAANAQSAPQQTATVQVMSSSDRDPNFPAGQGENQYFSWQERGGVPSVNARAGQSMYLGFDKGSGISYLRIPTANGVKFMAYKQGAAPYMVDSLPKTIARPPGLARNDALYGGGSGETARGIATPTATGSTAVPAANAQSTPQQTATVHFMSPTDKDPNFPGVKGENQYYVWKEVGGVPQVYVRGGQGIYLGFDKATATSYLHVNAGYKKMLMAYKQGSAPYQVDKVPGTVSRPPLMASHSALYGGDSGEAASGSASPTESGRNTTSAPPAPSDVFQATVSQRGPVWTVRFTDEAKTARDLEMTRPHIRAYGQDFTPQVWDNLNRNQGGVGMWIANDSADKKRIVDVKQGGKTATVSMPMTSEQLSAFLQSNSIVLIPETQAPR